MIVHVYIVLQGRSGFLSNSSFGGRDRRRPSHGNNAFHVALQALEDGGSDVDENDTLCDYERECQKGQKDK